MIKDSYPLESFHFNQAFLFDSIGSKGVIRKVIVFELMEDNYYNLAFGDYINGKMDDSIITNNHDLIKVMSTVALTIYMFLDKYPKAIIEIDPVDKKRRRLYNVIFKRKHLEVLPLFEIMGINGSNKEPYNPNQVYQKFEIYLKNE